MGSKIENQGFLSHEAKEGISTIRNTYTEAFAFAEEINGFAIKQLAALNLDWSNHPRIVIAVLLVRIIEAYQAILLLFERGIIPPAQMIARAILEALFPLCAIQKDNTLIQCYLNQYEKAHLQKLKASLRWQHGPLKQAVKKHKLEEVYREKERELKNKDLQVLRPHEWATAAGLDDFYNIYYVLYSDTIHSNPALLDHHFDEEPSTERSLAFGPSDKYLYDTLRAVVIFVLTGLGHATEAYGNDIRTNLISFEQRLKKLDTKYGS